MGHLLSHIKPHVREVVGVDYDTRAVRFARRVLRSDVYACGLHQAGLERGSFGLVCCVNTLEHADDPIAFVSLLAEHAAPSGMVYIEVANLDDALLSLYECESYKQFYFRESQLLYFTASSLGAVARRAGLTGTITFLQHYNVLNHLRWALCAEPSDIAGPTGVGRPEGLAASTPNGSPLVDWLRETDESYRAMLARSAATDAIAFIGRRTSSERRSYDAHARLD